MAGDPAGLDAVAAAARAVGANPRPELADPAWSWGTARGARTDLAASGRERVEQQSSPRPEDSDHRGESEDGGRVPGGNGHVVRVEGEELEVEMTHRVEQLGPRTAQASV